MTSPLKTSHLTPKYQKEVSLSIKDKENLWGLLDVFIEQKDKPLISMYLCCTVCYVIRSDSPDILVGSTHSLFPQRFTL